VLTDNGACYRSRTFAAVLAEAGIKHKRTRPYRPQTMAKSSALTASSRRSGPMPRPTAQKPKGRPATRTSSSTTISAGLTPHSKAPHQSVASSTNRVSTASRRRA
jgi:hypothetical protein